MKKMRKYRRGNVSILVMFIMIASALIGLLAMHFVQQMLKYSWVIHDYYKSYYLANAGVEMWITESTLRGIGFSTNVASGSSFFKNNFLCDDENENVCDLQMKVVGKTAMLGEKIWIEKIEDCTKKNAFHLKQWENIILPLFTEQAFSTQKENIENLDSMKNKDKTPEKRGENLSNTTTYTSFSERNIEGIKLEIKEWSSKKANFWFVAMEKEGKDWNQKLGKLNSKVVYFKQLSINKLSSDLAPLINWQQGVFSWFVEVNWKNVFQENFLYFMIGNPNNTELAFCIQSPTSTFSDGQTLLPTQKFQISSLGTYHNDTIGLEAQYRQAIPSFFMNTQNNK